MSAVNMEKPVLRYPRRVVGDAKRDMRDATGDMGDATGDRRDASRKMGNVLLIVHLHPKVLPEVGAVLP